MNTKLEERIHTYQLPRRKIRKIRNIRDIRKFRGVLAIAIVAFGVVLGSRYFQKGDPLQPSIASKVLRFHVLANSDSEADQELKLQVRDAIGQLMEPKLAGVSDMKETEAIVQKSIPEIVATAENTLNQNGCEAPVTAELTNTKFPVKTYGSYTFPAGEYRALEVVIGNGQGHNWWCVLYPNMCFRDSVYEVVDEDAGEELKKVLSTQEYEDVFESGNYEVEWKLLDYFK